MDKFNKLPQTIKTLIIITFVLLIYSYLCRLIGLNFFWESKILGWSLLLVCIISLLLQRIQTKKTQEKKTLSEKIAIGLVSFILLVVSIWFVLVPQTDSYKIAKEYLITDKEISNEVGEVNSIVLVPVGNISISTTSEGTKGQAQLSFIVKGNNKFKDITILLNKNINSDWTIIKP